MTSNFAWQVSGSIWVTYGTIGLLGLLEVWYLKNSLRIPGFISIAYYINFGGCQPNFVKTYEAEIWYVSTRYLYEKNDQPAFLISLTF